jgi:transposase
VTQPLCDQGPVRHEQHDRAAAGQLRTDHRHRLNRGGNRQLNQSLQDIALTQISRDPKGRAYDQRKLAEGRTKPDALRCLKRRISDRVYQTL